MAGRNGVRGDVRIVLNGTEAKLLLTFGALAEIETELGISDLAELAARLRRMSPQDLWVVVGALLRAAGDGKAAALIDHAQTDIADVATAVAQAFREEQA